VFLEIKNLSKFRFFTAFYYINFRRYVPELRNLPVEYLYEPWKAPLDMQKEANCIIGQHYPERIVNHQEASSRNRQVSKPTFVSKFFLSAI